MKSSNTVTAVKESMRLRSYRSCAQCVLTTEDVPDIRFNSAGICQYCEDYQVQKARYVIDGEAGRQKFLHTIEAIKIAGRGKPYDCLIGVSGGVDSSYVAYLAWKHDLRALCVHFDNGWNSETAVSNIERITQVCGFDLETYVIDWEEFRQMQIAYLKASVVDIEVLTDHAIYGSIYQIAKKSGIQYILGGHNVATEAILPNNWAFNCKDSINIQDIYNKYGDREISNFPYLTPGLSKALRRSGIESVNFLNWLPYNKKVVKQLLAREIGWKDYGSKHQESIFTKFYQVYILPRKFNIDKRKAHLSNLICSGQISREEALEELKQPICDPQELEQMRRYVLKKLQLSESEFEAIMHAPIRSHWEFEFEGSLFHKFPVLKPLRPVWRRLQKMINKK